MPPAVSGPLSHKTSHTAAKQHLSQARWVGGGTRAPSAAGRTLWRTRDCPKAGQRAVGPALGRSPRLRPTSQQQVKQQEGPDTSSGAHNRAQKCTRVHTHYTFPPTRKHND